MFLISKNMKKTAIMAMLGVIGGSSIHSRGLILKRCAAFGFGKGASKRSFSIRTESFSSDGANIIKPSRVKIERRPGLGQCFQSAETRLFSKGTPSTSFDEGGTSPFFITTPIYYVNDKPHIGHAYTSLACDVIARYMRLAGREVYFLTGTDEHGQKVEEAAKKNGMEPQEWADKNSVSFRELLQELHITNDQFIRTTNDEHKAAVQHLWKELVDKEYIYLGFYEGWYSVRDECFYTESELVDGKAPTGAEVEWVVKEPSYFFKLSAFEDRLLEYYDSHPDFIAPISRRNEVVSFVKGGLKDLSISRTAFKWGVPVPDDKDHIMYVWIDALTNYISALGYPNMSGGSMYQKFWPAGLHMVGKDILRFHAVYWPAFLMAADLPLPKRLFAHGWWTKDGEKISKSLGNVIDPLQLVSQYGVDQTRFFLMSDGTFGGDQDFSDDALIRKCNANLANEFGNLCQRTLSMAFKNCGKAIPNNISPSTYTPEDKALLEAVGNLQQVTGEAIANQAIHKYAQALVTMVYDANKYIDEQAPWVLRKTDAARMEVVLYVLLETIRQIAILYQPLIPTASKKVLDLLSVPEDERTFSSLQESPLKQGVSITKPVGVFPRIEVPETAATSA